MKDVVFGKLCVILISNKLPFLLAVAFPWIWTQTQSTNTRDLIKKLYIDRFQFVFVQKQISQWAKFNKRFLKFKTFLCFAFFFKKLYLYNILKNFTLGMKEISIFISYNINIKKNIAKLWYRILCISNVKCISSGLKDNWRPQWEYHSYAKFLGFVVNLYDSISDSIISFLDLSSLYQYLV